MADISVDFATITGRIGMLHGMNNGPETTIGSLEQEYRELGVPFVRFHETLSPTTKCVEIPFIFRQFEKDENDPANYFFGPTDKCVEAAVRNKVVVMYRLGMGTEAMLPRKWCKPPEDFDKWARIAVNIIRHYNDGWANGFHYGLKYWEIWNEPDLKEYWSGEYADFFRLYEKAAKAIKAHDPRLKVGGPGAACCYGPNDEFTQGFFGHILESNSPIDFFSWHFYCDNSQLVRERADAANATLEKYGLRGKIENINSEWHGTGLHGAAQQWDLRNVQRISVAVCNAAAMIVMQKAGVDIAAYYDFDPRTTLCGIVDPYYRKYKSFYPFKMFNYLYRAGNECASSCNAEGMYGLRPRRTRGVSLHSQ